MRKFIIVLFSIAYLNGLAQQLPATYPSYYFVFEQTDSINYRPIYPDWKVRDSLKSNFGGGNRHREALAVEQHELKTRNIDFLKRQESNQKQWNIELLNGEIFELKIPKYSEVADYAFEHYYEQLNLIVFREQWYEGNAYLIVNRKNGNTTRTLGSPIISPNNQFLIGMNDDLEAGYSPNGIQLFEITNEKILLQLEFLMDLGPTRATWNDNSTFQLEAYSQNWENGLRYEYQHYRVRIKKSDP